jgi:hypothetical protein
MGHALDELEATRSPGCLVQDAAVGNRQQTIAGAMNDGHGKVDPADRHGGLFAHTPAVGDPHA